MAVDYAGHPVELNELREIADKHGIYLIEDAAHSIGSEYRGKKVGSIADLTTFSFFPTKNMTTGEGGAISSLNSELLERARIFSRQGLIREESNFKLESHGPWHQEVHDFGLNYRLPDILCALGISQIAKIEKFKNARTQVFDTYEMLLSNVKGIRLPTKRDYVNPMWHLYPVRVKAEHRRRIFEGLRAKEIGVQVNYIPAHLHPVFGQNENELPNLRNSIKFYSEEISLPMMANNKILDKDSLAYISKNLSELVGDF